MGRGARVLARAEALYLKLSARGIYAGVARTRHDGVGSATPHASEEGTTRTMARVARRPANETSVDPEDDGRDRPSTEEAAERASTPDAQPARKPLGAATSTSESRREVRDEKANDAAGTGPNVFPSGDEGDTVTAVSAESLYTPKQYTSFRVGPFTVQTRVRAGETSVDALRRAQKAVDKIHDETFEVTLAKFVVEQRKAEGALR